MGRPKKIAEDGMTVVEEITQEDTKPQERKTDGMLYLKKNGVTRRFHPQDGKAARADGWE